MPATCALLAMKERWEQSYVQMQRCTTPHPAAEGQGVKWRPQAGCNCCNLQSSLLDAQEGSMYV